ncbi:hypothetical protein ANN_18605 [Periplaneta americana]|uniref:Uncharacterized protein n=1 Tax=Periplaneta americana TaxID=6978 RepID=A0ABQ8SQF9_PERAM|nr:hypothetical protein ANN_18605 [Periplaneta americana]
MAGLCEGGNESPGFLKVIIRPNYALAVLVHFRQESDIHHSCSGLFKCNQHIRDEFQLANIMNDIRQFDCLTTLYQHSVLGHLASMEIVFGEMRPRIRHRLPDIRLMVGENLEKTQHYYHYHIIIPTIVVIIIIIIIIIIINNIAIIKESGWHDRRSSSSNKMDRKRIRERRKCRRNKNSRSSNGRFLIGFFHDFINCCGYRLSSV